MQIIYWIIIGIVAGFIAEKVMGSDHGLLMNLVVGIAGAIIGGFLAGLVGIASTGIIGTLIIATIGAILLLWGLRMLRRT